MSPSPAPSEDAGPAARPTLRERLRRARLYLAAGALSAIVGLALAGTVSRTWGEFLVITGWLVLVAGIHAFGRSGTDA